MATTPHTFLESVAGYSQDLMKDALGSAAQPIRLAVIDPTYVATSYPTTLPRVTFEGEDTLSDKRYVVIDRSYQPGPGDRVVMLPVGHTFVIGGVVTPALVPRIFDQDDVTAQVSTTNTSYVSLTGGPTATIDLRAGQYAEIIVSADMRVADAGAVGGVMSWRSTGASGTVEAVDINGHETGSIEWDGMERTTIYGPASSGGAHNFEARYKAIGATTADFKNRRILAKAE